MTAPRQRLLYRQRIFFPAVFWRRLDWLKNWRAPQPNQKADYDEGQDQRQQQRKDYVGKGTIKIVLSQSVIGRWERRTSLTAVHITDAAHTTKMIMVLAKCS